MPELRGTRIVGSRPVGSPGIVGVGTRRGVYPVGRRGVVVGGYGIFRGASPRGRDGGGRMRRVVSAENDQENIPPGGQRRRRSRASPLPRWYPRTPLRDITAVVLAIERRRALLGEMTLRRTEGADRSAHDESLVRPSLQELNIAEDISPIDPTPCVASENDVCERDLSLPPGLSSPLTPAVCKPLNCLIATKTPMEAALIAESEERVSRSIDLIEKLLKEKFKDTTQRHPQGLQEEGSDVHAIDKKYWQEEHMR